MKKRIWITQRVDVIAGRDERRDALDQRWVDLLLQAGLQPVIVPNHLGWIEERLVAESFDGLLLTGGNSLVGCGGDAPERDKVEKILLEQALASGTPVLGVCRGMQLILDHFGTTLKPVTGHVAAQQEIESEGQWVTVNSYHDWGITEPPAEFTVWARADDGVIKALNHNKLPLWAVMWHPERLQPFRAEDLALLARVFATEAS